MHVSSKITCTYVEISFVVVLGTLFIFGGLAFASYTHIIVALIKNYQVIAHFKPFASTSKVFQNKICSQVHPMVCI
jgi:hypothetical protein